MALFVPESDDTFGWVFLIIVGLFVVILILLHCLNIPLSYGKETDEGCSAKLSICRSQYNYRSAFVFIYSLPLFTYVITSFIVILSNKEIRDSEPELSTSNILYFVVSLCMIMIYFSKRALEICFIHIYSHNHIYLSTILFIVIMFNIAFIGIAYSVCCVIINDNESNNHTVFIIVGLIIFIPSIILNAIFHQQLRQSRLSQKTKNYIPLTNLPRMFQICICPHYIAEMFTFIALLITIRTCIMLLFSIAVFIDLVAKIRRNKQFYNTLNGDINQTVQLNEDKLPLPGQCLIKCTGNLKKDLSTLKQRYGDKYEELIPREMVEAKCNAMDDGAGNEGYDISVMQFNLLADGLSCAYSKQVTDKTFLNVDLECLQWTYRGIKLVEEILRFEPDIIGVEECDNLPFLMKYLSSSGYKSCYQIKNGSPINKVAARLSQERNEEIKMELDGVAVIYNAKKFKVCGKIQGIDSNDNKEKVTGLAVPLCIKKINEEILFVVTHLKSKKTEEGEEIRERQIKLLFNHLIENENDLPIVLCCDLNANPIQNKNGYDPLCYTSLTDKDVFGFESVYKLANGDEEPEYTTFKKREAGIDKHTIDYIFIKNGNWNVTKILQIPNDEMIPNWNYPSDHFSLMAQLTWK